jgi:DNA polymerase-3 subunit chi
MDIAMRPMLLNLRDAAPRGEFDRVLEVVPADPAARAPLRERWKHYQALGFEVAKHDM